MTAILSCTEDDLYLFSLPFAIKSWQHLGVPCMVFVPAEMFNSTKLKLIAQVCGDTSFWPFDAPIDKQATYAQCSRLYAAALGHIDSDETLITADADMCVFDKLFWMEIEAKNNITIVGADLVPTGQYPMCYISMAARVWREVMLMRSRTYQECLDDLLGQLEAQHFRGNYWAKDQETAYIHINRYNAGVQWNIDRAKPGTQFATRRADRDGWPNPIPLDIVDAHLPRPGYTDENFAKIMNLFRTMYPTDDTGWMVNYRSRYMKLAGL